VSKNVDVLVVYGTRPEAIKMAPVVRELQSRRTLTHAVAVTGQHREMLEQANVLFGVKPDHDLELMRPNQSLPDLFARALTSLDLLLAEVKPRAVLVHGDTSTAAAGAMAAFYRHVPVGHVEAGLRSPLKDRPFPEEMNRRLVSKMADWHFAPTALARENLVRENVSTDDILVTGNTGIDALLWKLEELKSNAGLRADFDRKFSYLDKNSKMVLVTGHRRENFGGGLEELCIALKRLSVEQNADVVYPVHMNPNVKEAVHRMIGGVSRIHLIEPQDYLSFLYLMDRCSVILTDSGGIQEEAPTLKKPVLVLRNETERPEGLAAGMLRLVPQSSDAIFNETSKALSDGWTIPPSVTNPYGDGKAAARIVDHLENRIGALR
jgi:UDP-N-acetylglucosamine 2-epimerase (non-hydrolysing)